MVPESTQKNDPINWLDQYGDRLYRFARARVRDSFAAEDLVQETLLAAYRSRERFSGRSTVSTWLTGILKHKIVDYYRKLTPESGDESIDGYAIQYGEPVYQEGKMEDQTGRMGGRPPKYL